MQKNNIKKKEKKEETEIMIGKTVWQVGAADGCKNKYKMFCN